MVARECSLGLLRLCLNVYCVYSEVGSSSNELQPVALNEHQAASSARVVVERTDCEMESGIESDTQDDDADITRHYTSAAAAASGHNVTSASAAGQQQSSSVDELIQSLTVPPPPSRPTLDTELLSELARLARAPPPSSPLLNRCR